MKLFKFACDDRYEAEKLAGLLSVQKNGTLYVDGITAIIGNEVVLKLKDKSSHAVVMKDEKNVASLEALLQNVIKGRIAILSSDFEGAITEVKVGEEKKL
jgi:hypothetical protein